MNNPLNKLKTFARKIKLIFIQILCDSYVYRCEVPPTDKQTNKQGENWVGHTTDNIDSLNSAPPAAAALFPGGLRLLLVGVGWKDVQRWRNVEVGPGRRSGMGGDAMTAKLLLQ